eukprot:sb/3478401/
MILLSALSITDRAKRTTRLRRVVLFTPFNVNNTVAMATELVTMGTGICHSKISTFNKLSLEVSKVWMAALQLCVHRVFYEGADCRLDTAERTTSTTFIFKL